MREISKFISATYPLFVAKYERRFAAHRHGIVIGMHLKQSCKTTINTSHCGKIQGRELANGQIIVRQKIHTMHEAYDKNHSTVFNGTTGVLIKNTFVTIHGFTEQLNRLFLLEIAFIMQAISLPDFLEHIKLLNVKDCYI